MQFLNKLNLKAIYDAQELADNVQGNPKSGISVPLYTMFCPIISEYFELTS